MAFAAARFAYKVLDALNGADNKVECAYVRSTETPAAYFATPILLGVSRNFFFYKLYILNIGIKGFHMVCVICIKTFVEILRKENAKC